MLEVKEIPIVWRGSVSDFATDISHELTPAQVLELCKHLVDKAARYMNGIYNEQQLADWLVQTCRVFGTSFSTGYTIAGLFLKALDR